MIYICIFQYPNHNISYEEDLAFHSVLHFSRFRIRQ